MQTSFANRTSNFKHINQKMDTFSKHIPTANKSHRRATPNTHTHTYIHTCTHKHTQHSIHKCNALQSGEGGVGGQHGGKGAGGCSGA